MKRLVHRSRRLSKRFRGHQWLRVVLAATAMLLVGGLVTIMRQPAQQAVSFSNVHTRLFAMTRADYGTRVSSLPVWQQHLLSVKYGTTQLDHFVPVGGEQLFDPSGASPANAYATPLILRPGSPTRSDVTNAQADATALADYGPAVTNTVFGIATLVTQLPPARQPVPAGAVVNSPVWVVTITPASPLSPISCGSPGSSCAGNRFTNWIVIINASDGHEILAFEQ